MIKNLLPYRAKESVRCGRFLNVLVCALIFVELLSFPVYSAEVVYESGGRRDPFIPLVSAKGGLTNGGEKKSANDYRVEGIVFDPREGSFALINGKFYKKGDQIDRAQLVGIAKDKVILSINNEEKVVWLREEAAEK